MKKIRCFPQPFRRSTLAAWGLFLLLNSFAVLAHAQHNAPSIKGIVQDEKGNPLSGVSIEISCDSIHFKKNALSDNSGLFTLTPLRAHIPYTIVFSYVGYNKQMKERYVLQPEETASMMINLAPALDQSLNDVVVVGYGTQKRGDITGAVSTVDVAKTFENKPLSDPIKALQGVVPGLTISYNNGGLTASAAVNIRGIGSLSGTKGSPLILVDNVETPDLSVINPLDIESVSVLKDAASASIYGARAAFGVVLIKTKSGLRNQKTTVTYSNNFGWGNPTVMPDFSDPVPELQALYDGALRSGNKSPQTFGMDLLKLKDGIANWEAKYSKNRTSDEMIPGEDFDLPTANDPAYFYRVWDVKDMMFRAQPQQQHNLRISGGSDKLAYYLSFGYNDDGGILKMNPDNIKKYNITAGINSSIAKWWDVDVKMMYRNFEYSSPYGYQDYFYYLERWGAYWPLGTYQGSNFNTVAAYLNNAQTNTATDNYTRVDLGTTLKIAKHFDARAVYTINRDNVLTHQVGGPIVAWNNWTASMPLQDISSASANKVSYIQGRSMINSFNAYVQYENTFGLDHHVKAMVGINSEDDEDINFTATKNGLLDPNFGELPLSYGDQLASGSHGNAAYAGYFGRINYDYKGKYLLEVNGRYDGSSAFPPQDRWAFFSSASAGWRISEESFMQWIKPVINDWKFRGSLGSIGNQDVGGQFFLPTMPTGAVNWVSGGVLQQGIGQPRAVVQSLTWENVKTLDLGTDLSLINNQLTATFDWYQRTNSGMFTTQAIPATFGTNAPDVNDGSMRNRGWEFGLNGNVSVGKDLKLYGSVTLADSKTVITQWNNATKGINQNYTGEIYGSIWGFETDRYFTDDDFVKDGNGQPTSQTVPGVASQTPTLAGGNFVYGPGDIKYKDLNGDGKIDGGNSTATDHGDLTIIGNSQPRYLYSFRLGGSFKGFDLDAFFQGVGKQQYWGTGNIVLPMYQSFDILYANQLDYWTPEHTDALYPKPYANNQSGQVANLPANSGGNNFYPQTKYLLNLAYLRLKNLTIGYTLPKSWLGRYGFQALRVYASGQNLLTFSNVGAPIDPEAYAGATGNATGRTYPIQRVYSFGLQITFQ